ncbi:hypothetical protein [Proteiniphilum sp. X52]|uniref:hypothetical protein n=1 Tax=Proteiniphilum sp. X52 TaxID=2382159 RepID=UPI0011CDE901|nr:hypothetical protein [Proteiniphilum sp. X52]
MKRRLTCYLLFCLFISFHNCNSDEPLIDPEKPEGNGEAEQPDEADVLILDPQVWISKDFVNWYNYEMEIDLPDGLTNCWAPDVLKGDDGKYYYFMGNCQFGCNVYGYMSDSAMMLNSCIFNPLEAIRANMQNENSFK